MNAFKGKGDANEDAKYEAANWVFRWDRGLTPAEQDEFLAWLAANPLHGAQFARHRRAWGRTEKMADWCPEYSAQPNADLLAPTRLARLRRLAPMTMALAAAAALVIAFLIPKRAALPRGAGSTAMMLAQPEGQRTLEDGSIVELNRGATISVRFEQHRRMVNLEQGEAHFSVTKDPNRPFIVLARGIGVRAVGTAFNVRVDPDAVEVLVTEGRVQVDSSHQTSSTTPESGEPIVEQPLVRSLTAHQRAIVSTGPAAGMPQIDTLSQEEIERARAWQHRLLEFKEAPVSEIVAQFNRLNVVQLLVLDPEIASLKFSGSVRSDKIEAFVNLMQKVYGIRTEHRSDTEILLRRTISP